uniref:Uncharacterized protein ycf33 n=1 Tax=Trichogloeopsis pedicellata TaxID=1495610 RepID=A0A1G4P0S4_9FLOR|nr:Hypothetical protein ycf33 [Trichogloeopsis pedicellata]SCW24484.1 Hypothetical protein ycf33 [Trichogloeopsis pedicellata]
MYIFWENVWKFPRFLISVCVGFFLTAAYPFFQLSKNKKMLYLILFIFSLLSGIFYTILKSMLGYS